MLAGIRWEGHFHWCCDRLTFQEGPLAISQTLRPDDYVSGNLPDSLSGSYQRCGQRLMYKVYYLY